MFTLKTLFEEIRSRKLIQTLVIYAAGAWTVLQVVDVLTNHFKWPEKIFQIVFVLVICGIPVSIIIAWCHGKAGSQRIQTVEILLHSIILVLAIVFIIRIIINVPMQARSPLRTADAKSIAVMPFKNLSEDKKNEFFSDGFK